MRETEIKEIGRLLRLNSLIDDLTERVQGKLRRESNLRDSVYRAFRNTDTDTELMQFIRDEGRQLLAEKQLLPAELPAAA